MNNSLEKIKMPEQEPWRRKQNFEEVAVGYKAEMAVEEASRCLNCKHKPCVEGCPVNVDIPGFIQKIAENDVISAYEIIKKTNSLPAVCGRVCPQENQCEGKCVRGIKGEPVAIGRLERFVADCIILKEKVDAHLKEYGIAPQANSKSKIEEKDALLEAFGIDDTQARERAIADTENKREKSGGANKKQAKIAIVGSGPASLTCAGDLAKFGHDVTIYESLHVPGGVLMYGIPEFRLPKNIVRYEIDNLKKLGVKIQTNMIIGKTLTIDELLETNDAVFIGSGAGLPSFMNIEGETLSGVFSANEYLTRINLMKANSDDYDTPLYPSKNVAVVGGGNVAMDAARCALRIGARVSVIYRRSENEMPARKEEVHHAKEEGIHFLTLNNPIKILGDGKGRVKAIKCVKMELGEPDSSGRRSPVEIPNSDFLLPVDTVIMAIGTSPNPLLRITTKGLEANRRGCLIVDENLQTTRKKIYAGGDAVTGAATVISAMGAGKQAAAAIAGAIEEL